MEGISDIRIKGFDEERPPRIMKQPYINLYFKLTHKAPKDWCEDFNNIVAKGDYPVKIDSSLGLFVETWVRKPEEIAAVLEELKKAVTSAIGVYIDRIKAAAAVSSSDGLQLETEGEQGRLNAIVAGLNFKV